LVNKEFQHDNILVCYWPYLFFRAYWSECEQSRTAILYVLLRLRRFLPATVEIGAALAASGQTDLSPQNSYFADGERQVEVLLVLGFAW